MPLPICMAINQLFHQSESLCLFICGSRSSRTTHHICSTLGMFIIRKANLVQFAMWCVQYESKTSHQICVVAAARTHQRTESSFTKLWFNRWTALCAAVVTQRQSPVARSLLIAAQLDRVYSFRQKAATSIATSQANRFRTGTALVLAWLKIRIWESIFDDVTSQAGLLCMDSRRYLVSEGWAFLEEWASWRRCWV